MIEMHDVMESFLQIQWSCSSLMSPSHIELRRTFVQVLILHVETIDMNGSRSPFSVVDVDSMFAEEES